MWAYTVHRGDKARKAHRIHVVDFLEGQGNEFIHNLENTGELLKLIRQKNHWIRGRQEE